MTAAYDLARARRLLLLLCAAARTLPASRGLPLARAVAVTGARNERITARAVSTGSAFGS